MVYLARHSTKTFYNSTVYSSLNKNDPKKTFKKIKKRKKHISITQTVKCILSLL